MRWTASQRELNITRTLIPNLPNKECRVLLLHTSFRDVRRYSDLRQEGASQTPVEGYRIDLCVDENVEAQRLRSTESGPHEQRTNTFADR